MRAVREAGARIRLIPHGDVSAALSAVTPGSPIDLLERTAALEAGYDLEEVLDTDRLVTGDDVFFCATGVTDGDMLAGARFEDPEAPAPSRW